ELPTDYRLLDIDGLLDAGREDGDLLDRNLSLLSKLVAYQEKAPVALLRDGGGHMLAIPAELELTREEYVLTPDVVTLRPRSGVRRVDPSRLSPHDAAVRRSFLRFGLSSPFMRDDTIWSSRNSAFFAKTPVNYRDDRRDVDVYEGFGYRVVEVGGKLFVSLRLVYRY